MKKYRIFVTDVDGVLTDGRITYLYNEQSGISEIKSFNAKDGSAIKKLMSSGVIVALISGRLSGCVAHRAAELNIPEVHLGVNDKLDVFNRLLVKYGLSSEDAVFVGDDSIDLECLDSAGLSCVPNDCLIELKNRADYVCESAGGQGVISEIYRVFGENFEV